MSDLDKLYSRPILYTDTIKGEQTLRDDLWAVTTEELKDLILKSSLIQLIEVIGSWQPDGHGSMDSKNNGDFILKSDLIKKIEEEM